MVDGIKFSALNKVTDIAINDDLLMNDVSVKETKRLTVQELTSYVSAALPSSVSKISVSDNIEVSPTTGVGNVTLRVDLPRDAQYNILYQRNGFFDADANFTYDARIDTLNVRRIEGNDFIRTPDVIATNNLTIFKNGGFGNTSTVKFTTRADPGQIRDTTFYFPNTDGPANSYLSTDGNGNLIFSVPPTALDSRISNQNIIEWNSAYAWGNHKTAGYLKVEADPVFNASPAGSITNTDVSEWNTAYGWGDHRLGGYLTAYTETDPVFLASPAGSITLQDIYNWDNSNVPGGGSTGQVLTKKSDSAYDTEWATLSGTGGPPVGIPDLNEVLLSGNFSKEDIILNYYDTGTSSDKPGLVLRGDDVNKYMIELNSTNSGNSGIVWKKVLNSTVLTADPSAVDILFQLPPDNGTADYILYTDGNGVTRWDAAPAGSGGTPNITDVLQEGNETEEDLIFQYYNNVSLTNEPSLVLRGLSQNANNHNLIELNTINLAPGSGGDQQSNICWINGAYNTTLTADPTVDGIKFQLPDDNGTLDYVLHTDGNGITSWKEITVTGGGGTVGSLQEVTDQGNTTNNPIQVTLGTNRHLCLGENQTSAASIYSGGGSNNPSLVLKGGGSFSGGSSPGVFIKDSSDNEVLVHINDSGDVDIEGGVYVKGSLTANGKVSIQNELNFYGRTTFDNGFLCLEETDLPDPNTDNTAEYGNIRLVDGKYVWYNGVEWRQFLHAGMATVQPPNPTPPEDPTFSDVLFRMQYDKDFGNVAHQNLGPGYSGAPYVTGSPEISSIISKFGGGSLRMRGSVQNEYLYYEGEVEFPGDFTIECWVYLFTQPATSSQPHRVILSVGNALNNGEFMVYMEPDDNRKLYFDYFDNTTDSKKTLNIGAVSSLNRWYHIAIARDTVFIRTYLDGVEQDTAAEDGSWDSNSNLMVGSHENGDRTWDGYIDDVRITRDCRYKTDFTPPTEALPISDVTVTATRVREALSNSTDFDEFKAAMLGSLS